MTQIATPEDVRTYWLSELEPKDWYIANEAVDAAISDRFKPTWVAARDGKCADWLTSADDVLSYLILCDQFPRNMFRGHGDSFATDAQCLVATRLAIEKGWDLQIAEPARQFIYVPLMHSENLDDQDQAFDMFQTRMPETGAANHDHALAHRYVIATFGRFPYRNAALGRETTAQEQAFLDAGGYGHALRLIQAEGK